MQFYTSTGGQSPQRTQLAAVLRASGPLVTVDSTVAALSLDRSDAAKLLARWTTQGRLGRLRRGVYAPVPLDQLEPGVVLDDPWIVVPQLFGPAYIGGWTAAEHWGLTEQVFKSVLVFTTRPVRKARVTVQETPFVLHSVAADALFGTRPVWRGRIRVDISDPHRTVVDMLDDPRVAGGIRHADDCLGAYLASPAAAPEKLIEYGDRRGNGAVFKRLGFLLERRHGPAQLLAACKERMTAGNAKLDSATPCPRLVKRWRLWIPETWVGEAKGD